MNITQVITLVIVAWLLGFLRRYQPWKSLLIFTSMSLYYWLQPSSPIRYVDFWLPTFVVILAWLTYAGMLSFRLATLRKNIGELGLVLLPTLAASLNRYLAICCITPTLPPSIDRVLIFLILAIFIVTFITRVSPQKWHFPFIILILFIIFMFLKTPYLTLQLSKSWREFNHQPIQYSLPIDIQWLGISYIILRMAHILIDVGAKRQPLPDFQTYFLYLIFFPALIAGPIDLFPHFQKEVNAAPQTPPLRLEGFKRIILGAFKKFVLADTLAILALSQQNATHITAPLYLWLALIFYSWRIYFDFSGYTDIAIGSALLIGIRLPENFSAPYFKTNLIQFWNSWHITLANWFRAYFFYPFVRKFQRNQSLPPWLLILIGQGITMILIGLWHGISPNYFLWGLWHGIGLFINNRWKEWAGSHAFPFLENRLTQFASWLITFTYVSLGWVWFLITDFGSARIVFNHLFGIGL